MNKTYEIRTEMLLLSRDQWEKVKSLEENGKIKTTASDFLLNIGLPSSKSAHTNEEEKEFIKEIYCKYRQGVK